MHFVNTSCHHPENKFTISKSYKESCSSNCFKNSCSEFFKQSESSSGCLILKKFSCIHSQDSFTIMFVPKKNMLIDWSVKCQFELQHRKVLFSWAISSVHQLVPISLDLSHSYSQYTSSVFPFFNQLLELPFLYLTHSATDLPVSEKKKSTSKQNLTFY